MQSEQVPYIEPFEVRRHKGPAELLVRFVQAFVTLFLLLTVAPMMASQTPRALLAAIPGVVMLVATMAFLGFITLRRYVYWRVDQEGIHQRYLGMPIWHLPWAELASRELGKLHNTWIWFWLLPIAGGPDQKILLKDRRGRTRKVNRMATNGDRLDVLVRLHLDPRGEAELEERHSRAIDTATWIHRKQTSTESPLHLITRDSPIVRMKVNEPIFVDACCNCLGPVAQRVQISMSPGLLGRINPRYEGLPIPLCGACLARTRTRNQWPPLAPLFGFLMLMAAFMLIAACTSDDIKGNERLKMLLIGGISLPLSGCVLWWNGKRIRRPTYDRLVKVVRLTGRQGWMEVQFGNPEYARLMTDVVSAGLRTPQ
jgi:hypothetical protein